MKALITKPDIPFDRDDANRFLPIVIGLMVCLTGLFLAASISIGGSSAAAGKLDIRAFQIYVPHQETSNGLVESVKKAVMHGPEAKEVTVMSNKEMASLIEPWTGASIPLDRLPIPTVLDVRLNNDVEPMAAVEAISKRVKMIDQSIEIENYKRWIDQLLRFTSMLRTVAIIMAVLLTAGLVTMVVLAARTSLKLNFKTVAILHNVGARDDYIIQQFVTNGVWMVLRGAALGTGIAIITAIGLSSLAAQMNSPLLPSISITPTHIVMFVFLPLFTAMVAYVAVRFTVQSMLEHMH